MNPIAWRNRVLSLGLVVCLAATVIAQAPAPAPLPSGMQPPEQPTASPELQRRMKTKISVDFREAPIEDVIKSLAEQADIDIVKGPAVTGTVTATLTDVSLDEAMESIFSVHGFGYTTSESIVRIIPKGELAQYIVKYRTKMYRIDYADIEELNTLVSGMLTDRGKIAMSKTTGHLCVTDTEDQIEMLDEFIAEMDRETPQILVEARIYDVSCSDYMDLGFDWFAGSFTLFDPTTGLPTLYDPATGSPIVANTEPYRSAGFGSGIGQAPKGNFGLQVGFLNDNVDISATFTAIKDKIKSRLLANPKILVLNDEEATIKIVEEIPYQELTQTSGGGNIGTTKFKEVGVELVVTPHVTREGKIRLLLNPMFSVQTGSVPIFIPTGTAQTISSAQPIVNTREAATQALIKDGDTVVIGGLRKKDIVREISKVPLVSDIPILGELFKFRGEKTVNSELIVFITPRLVVKPELSASDSRKLETTETELCEPEGPEPTADCCAEE